MQTVKNRIPDQGSVETMMQRLCSYIAPVNPCWFPSLRPANEEDIIKQKRKLCLDGLNLELPASYLKFLKYAGEGDGGLFENTLGAEMALGKQFSYQNIFGINDCDESHPYCVEFIRTMDLNIPFTMNLEKNNKIFYDMSTEFSSSFENLVFQCAVEIYEKLYFQLYEMMIPSGNKFCNFDVVKQGKELFSVVDKIVKENKLHKAWFSDDLFYFAYSDEMSLFINSRECGFTGMIFYNQVEAVTAIKEKLVSDIDVILYQ